MKLVGVREFRDKATEMFRSSEPVVVLRRGEVVGIYFPYPHQTLPAEFKPELFAEITDSIRERLDQAGIDEAEILEDFEAHRQDRGRR